MGSIQVTLLESALNLIREIFELLNLFGRIGIGWLR